MATRNESSVGVREASERAAQAVGDERMRHDPTLFDDFAEPPANDPALEAHSGGGWADIARHQMRHFADLVANEVQEHPVRSMLLASAVGYLIATNMRSRVIPALLRSGAGIAAAMVVREIAERGFGRFDAGSGRSA